MQDTWSKLAKWLFFTVVVSIIPLFADYISRAAARGNVSFNEIIAKGELSLICAALSGVAAGELYGLSEKARLFKICLGGICFINALLSVFMYLGMKSATGEVGSLFLDKLCWWLFFETVITSTVAVAVSEAKK